MVSQKPTIGLALGGGAARGLAYIGIFQAFEEAGIPIDTLAGTSSGALLGAIYASGVSPQDMEQIASTITWRDIAALRPTMRSFLSNHRIYTLLQRHCRARRFDELRIPLAVAVSDLETGQQTIITEGELFPAIQASCSIPFLFPSVKLNGRYYIDGGFAAQIPVAAVKTMGVMIAIACDANYNAMGSRRPSNMVTLLVHLMKLVAKRSAADAKEQVDVVINVDAQGIGLMEIGKGVELIRRGKQAVEAVLPQLEKLRQKIF